MKTTKGNFTTHPFRLECLRMTVVLVTKGRGKAPCSTRSFSRVAVFPAADCAFLCSCFFGRLARIVTASALVVAVVEQSPILRITAQRIQCNDEKIAVTPLHSHIVLLEG